MKPIIFFEGSYTVDDINNLKKKEQIFAIHDIYRSQREELFEITHPNLKYASSYKTKLDKFLQVIENKENTSGNWVYFPWSGKLIHTVNEQEYYKLYTNRNRNLITENEQEILKNFSIGIVGLSAGSEIASILAHSGISKAMKLAEFDTLDTTNLNRVRAPLGEIGNPKIQITARQLYEVNPYLHLILFREGLNESLLSDFMSGEPRLRLIFEMIDNFEMKIRLRLAAREAGIPVIMFSNIGDNTLIDVERYDENKDLPLLNGRVGKTPEEILDNPDVTDEDKNKYAVELVGKEYIPKRALDSVKEIGKTLVGRPQLMSTITISSGIAAYFARKIAIGEQVSSGRYFIDFKKAFLPELA